MKRLNPNVLNALHTALHEKSGEDVEIEWLAAQAGMKEKTLWNYVSKNMLAPHVLKVKGRKCRIAPQLNLSLGSLRRCLSQRANLYTWEHLGVSELVSNLLDRSRTNAGLALELINRPELANRLDAFVLLFVTSWEQLLKADLEHRQRGSIFTGNKNAKGRTTTIGLSKVLDMVFPSSNDPVRKNIEVLKELRDGAAHLLVPELTGIVTRYFQSSLLNYIRYFQQVTEEPPFRFEGTGLLTLGVAYESPQIDALRVRHGTQASEIKALIEKLEHDAKSVDDKEFAVSIEYQLVLEKKAGPGSIQLVNGEGGAPVGTVKVPRDPKELYPYSTSEVAALLNQRTKGNWSQNNVAIVAQFLDVKKNDNELHYEFKNGSQRIHCYSDSFVDRLVTRFEQTPTLISDAYKAERQKKKAKRKR